MITLCNVSQNHPSRKVNRTDSNQGINTRLRSQSNNRVQCTRRK